MYTHLIVPKNLPVIMTKIKDKDVVLLHYVGSFPENGQVFDTSIESVAKENEIHNPQREYTPLTVTIGEGQVIPGLETALIDMEVDQKKSIDVAAVDAYGERDDTKMIELPKSPFGEKDIDPEVGMMLQTEAGIATITKVTDEVVTLDFNHALAGRDLNFDVMITRIN
jgi:FKBP-type peptidyl-prolyl cis-trans isomerase 2